MDPFSDILNLLSATSYTTAGLSTGNNWAMTFPGFHGFKFIVVRKGSFLFRLKDELTWKTLGVGEGVILTRKMRFVMATNQECAPLESTEEKRPRVRETVNYGGDDNILIAGKMEIDLVSSELLLQELPETIFFQTQPDEPTGLSPLMKLLFMEKLSNRPGASQACNHLMHLIMIEALRAWYESSPTSHKGILKAYKDPRIVAALNAIHNEPEKNWRLHELASTAGMSRAGFSKTFSGLTGQTPIGYVTNWRMLLASKMLRLGNRSVKDIGFSLGYQSESIFSSAFKRIYGLSPKTYRATMRCL
ncbi:AraC family transcriptional regulator [Klebsiella quasivariicola]|uniref:AraC family transcriptional regulator n=1 Tax=Klebsiella quasivariicola TaxID=2026240 RepID=UPI001CCB461E|nr:AraC family transcriptional regulator [Klebsiella quasivariicola]MBZ9581520.1 AraC family transcriptional regulator [Klebsiella quasivariicola]